ncbi:hypothetical protein Hanom_Chr05g00469801 [Helianthus anomalus]
MTNGFCWRIYLQVIIVKVINRQIQFTFPERESTNSPTGLSPTTIRSLPSGLIEVCCICKQ